MAKTSPMSRGGEETPASPRRDAQASLDVPVSPGGIVAGKYRIDAVIGFGGMGIVCEGFHRDLETKVEVQIARRGHMNDERAVARFLSEARSAAQLRSQHARRVMDCGRLDVGAPYVVVEYLDGVDLRCITAHGRLPVEEAVSFALQACEAMGEAHSRGLVHGDLRPESLFLTRGPDGGALIKVLDLGVSKQLGRPPGSGALTESAEGIGLPQYRSPEQTIDPAAVDARTDVWSLGVLLYELITGELPYGGSSATPASANAMTAHPVSPRDRHAAIPESLAAIVLRCIDRNRDARFPDAAALGRALRALGGVASSVTAERVEEILRHARSSPPAGETSQSVADAPASVVDMPASVVDVSESVHAPTLPRSIPALPVLPPRPSPSRAPPWASSVPPEPAAPQSIPSVQQSEPVAPQSVLAAPRSSPAAARSVPAAARSVPAAAASSPTAARSVPAGRPSRGTGPPPLPPSHSPPSPTLNRLVGRRGAVFAFVGVLLGAFVAILASHRASPHSEPSRASALSTGAPVVAPAQPVVLPSAAPAASPDPPPLPSAFEQATASEPVAPPHEPAPSATPLPPPPPRPVRKRAWNPFPELKQPVLPPHVR